MKDVTYFKKIYLPNTEVLFQQLDKTTAPVVQVTGPLGHSSLQLENMSITTVVMKDHCLLFKTVPSTNKKV